MIVRVPLSAGWLFPPPRAIILIRLAAAVMLIDISVALLSTKLPIHPSISETP